MSDTSRFVEGVTYEVKRRGGTTLEHASFIGADREITVDTDKHTVVVHDGITPGGHPLATEADLKALEQQVITGGGEVDIDAIKDELRTEFRSVNDPIHEQDLGDDVKAKLEAADGLQTQINALTNNKVDRTELAAYRKTSVDIGYDDLTAEVQAKLDYTYNDTELKEVVNEVQNNLTTLQTTVNNKADNTTVQNLITVVNNKVDASEVSDNYRSKDVAITESDLDAELVSKINIASEGYDDTAVKADIADLQNNKADKSSLDDYRLKANAITISDLDTQLAADIEAGKQHYDDTTIRADITDLQNNKADRELLDDYRLKSDLIVEDDLNPAVVAKLNYTYDDTNVTDAIDRLDSAKADKVTLDDYRLKSTKITETDLTNELAEKINTAAEGYNDAELRNLVSAKADRSDLDNYRLKSDSITLGDLDNTAYTTITGKADASELANYRAKSENILESDLDTALIEKINAKLDALDAGNLYRSKSVSITESDLDAELQAKVNSSGSGSSSVDLTAIETRIKALEMKNPEVIYFDLGSPGGTTWRIEDITDIPEKWYEYLTNANIYGVNDDGTPAETGRRIKLFCLGPNNVTVPNPIEIPLASFDTFTITTSNSKCPYSNWTFDSTQGTHGAIIFGTASTAEYRLKFEFYPYTFVEA